MKRWHVTAHSLDAYEAYLWETEKSQNTVELYMREARAFADWAQGRLLRRSLTAAYKEKLLSRYGSVSTLNTKLAALNSLLSFLGRADCRMRALRRQGQSFTPPERELRQTDYERLLLAALERGRLRLYLLLQVLCGTGIRVSELVFITVEAAREGMATVTLKGKTRPVLLIQGLREQLLDYARARGIESGSIFLTRGGLPLDRKNIWSELKLLALLAGVDPRKVYPHNFRHLFARNYHALDGDMAALADLLGHSSMETTRIYTRGSLESCAPDFCRAAELALLKPTA